MYVQFDLCAHWVIISRFQRECFINIGNNKIYLTPIPPENITKCFQGVWKETCGMKWVKDLFEIHKKKIFSCRRIV